MRERHAHSITTRRAFIRTNLFGIPMSSLFKLMNAEEAGWLMRKMVVQGSNPNDYLTIFRWVWTLFDGENL